MKMSEFFKAYLADLDRRHGHRQHRFRLPQQKDQERKTSMKTYELMIQVGQTDELDQRVGTVIRFGEDEYNDWLPTKYEFSWGGKTDEGYSWTHCQIELDTKTSCLHQKVATTSKDCDGRYETYNSYVAPLSSIKNYKAEWVSVDSSQRDHSAEAMGY